MADEKANQDGPQPRGGQLSISERLRLMIHPKPDLVRLDTSLRYTDILFGFVIREIFLRLQYWRNLDRHAWLYLSVCLALVLGSWIGYRRSLNRSSYEVKFFNLPFFRFLLDQGMLILYFQVVNSSLVDLSKPWTDPTATVVLPPSPSDLANGTVKLLVLIFLLYWMWDILALWMAVSKVSRQPPYRYRYPDPKDNVSEDNKIKDDTKQLSPDKAGFAITSVCFGLFLVLWILLKKNLTPCLTPSATFVIAILLLLVYRLAKETRTSWR